MLPFDIGQAVRSDVDILATDSGLELLMFNARTTEVAGRFVLGLSRAFASETGVSSFADALL